MAQNNVLRWYLYALALLSCYDIIECESVMFLQILAEVPNRTEAASNFLRGVFLDGSFCKIHITVDLASTEEAFTEEAEDLASMKKRLVLKIHCG